MRNYLKEEQRRRSYHLSHRTIGLRKQCGGTVLEFKTSAEMQAFLPNIVKKRDGGGGGGACGPTRTKTRPADDPSIAPGGGSLGGGTDEQKHDQ